MEERQRKPRKIFFLKLWAIYPKKCVEGNRVYSRLSCTLREKITEDASLYWKSGVSLQHIVLTGKAGTMVVLSQQCEYICSA